MDEPKRGTELIPAKNARIREDTQFTQNAVNRDADSEHPEAEKYDFVKIRLFQPDNQQPRVEKLVKMREPCGIVEEKSGGNNNQDLTNAVLLEKDDIEN